MSSKHSARKLPRHLTIFGLVIGGILLGLWFFLDSAKHAKLLSVAIQSQNGFSDFYLEVADTEVERSKGLMFRKELDPEYGMIFVYEEESNHSFYMKNTFIALDMIFVSGDKKIVGILENVPILNEASRTVGEPSKYVIELVAGSAQKKGIKVGSEVRFDDIELSRVGAM